MWTLKTEIKDIHFEHRKKKTGRVVLNHRLHHASKYLHALATLPVAHALVLVLAPRLALALRQHTNMVTEKNKKYKIKNFSKQTRQET
jgi:hypothetical protein